MGVKSNQNISILILSFTILVLLKSHSCSQLNSTKLKPIVLLKLNITSINTTHDNVESEAPANPLNSIICDINKDCIVEEDDHRVCVDSVCQCYPDYKWDHQSYMCQHMTCFNENDCQFYDKHRLCDRNGFCVCRKGYAEDEYNKLCVTSMISQLWFCIQISVSIFIPSVCLFLAAIMYYREKKRRQKLVPLLNVVK